MKRRSIWAGAFRLALCGAAIAAIALPGFARAAGELRAPQNVNVRPTTPESSELNTAAARAQMQGQPEAALRLADQAIQANPRDPWPRYSRGMALASLGQTDQAITALTEAERSFGPNDPWGRSIAMWGQAHTFAQAGRCAEARAAYNRYASFVAAYDSSKADLALRYAAECQGPVVPRASGTAAPQR
jgi:tetratricopeptide (TPR) repeat protein